MTPRVNTPHLVQADVSFGVVLIPERVFRDHVTAASRAITAAMQNENVIDEIRFPAHVSLFLGGTTSRGMRELEAELGRVVASIPTVVEASRLILGNRGFVAVEVVKSPRLSGIANEVQLVCAAAHGRCPVYRPHLIARWGALSEERRQLLRAVGTYKTVDHWDPHVSVASVPEADLQRAAEIAMPLIPLPQAVRVEALQLVDVGHDNERWDVRQSWSTISEGGSVS
jgi:hypothetical protein